jgi:hypothetical protein
MDGDEDDDDDKVMMNKKMNSWWRIDLYIMLDVLVFPLQILVQYSWVFGIYSKAIVNSCHEYS